MRDYSRLAAAFGCALALLLSSTTAAAKPFESVHCIHYASLADYPVDAILFGTDRGKTMTAPFLLCVAKRGSEVVVLDAGYTNQATGDAWGAVDYASYAPLFAKIGVSLDQVSLVTVSHLHWDHAGATEAFPNAKFVIQKRELEFAAGGMTQNKHAQQGFVAEDVLAMVKLAWEGRVMLPDGDVEDLIPGLDVYLTPGHTMGTMTVCVDTLKGRVCYASDSVYTYRNIEEDIALGFGLDLYGSVESFAKIRKIVGKGTLIPGHDPELFSNPKKLGFKKIDDRIISVAE